jgi:hypothetical protein
MDASKSWTQTLGTQIDKLDVFSLDLILWLLFDTMLKVIVATLLFLGCGLLRCLAQKPQDIWLVIVAQSLNAISGPIRSISNSYYEETK